MSAAAPRRSARIAAKAAAAAASAAVEDVEIDMPAIPKVIQPIAVPMAAPKPKPKPIAADPELIRAMFAEVEAVREALFAARTRDAMTATIPAIDSAWRKAMAVYEHSATPMFLSDIKHHIGWSTMPLDEEHAWAVDAANAFLSTAEIPDGVFTPAEIARIRSEPTLQERVKADTKAAVAALSAADREKDIARRKAIAEFTTGFEHAYDMAFEPEEIAALMAAIHRLRNAAANVTAPGMEMPIIDALIQEIEKKGIDNTYPPLSINEFAAVFCGPAEF